MGRFVNTTSSEQADVVTLGPTAAARTHLLFLDCFHEQRCEAMVRQEAAGLLGLPALHELGQHLLYFLHDARRQSRMC